MANVDSAFGLRPYGGLSPSNATMQSRKYLINPSGYGTTIFQGDLVKFNAGYIEQAGVSRQLGGRAHRAGDEVIDEKCAGDVNGSASDGGCAGEGSGVA